MLKNPFTGRKKIAVSAAKMGEQPFFSLLEHKNGHFGGGGAKLWSAKSWFCWKNVWGGYTCGIYIYIWRLADLNIPPIDTLLNCPKFSIREITPKTRVFWTPHVGAHTKNERISEKFRVYMVGKIFWRAGYLFSPVFNGNLGVFAPNGPKTPPAGMRQIP